MNRNASQFIGSIPEHYDSGLGPILFHDYGEDLAARAAAFGATGILEIAAGTGIVSRKLRDALPPHTALTVTDLNPPMLAVAQGKFREEENVTFQPADALDLPFDDNAFDLVVCQFGVMFFPDKQKAYREVLRVLRPGGAYLLNVWGDHAANPFAEITHETAAGFFPEDPPQFYKVPFSYPDTTAVEADLKTAGFHEISSETIAIEKEVRDWARFARGIVFGNPFIDEIENRGVDADDVLQAILAAFTGRFGRSPSSMPLLATVYKGHAP